MTRILFQNALIVTMDPARRVIDGGAIVVDGRLIAGIFPAGAAPVPEPEDEIVDLRGYIVIPGLINTHVHTSQHLARGLGDDADLLTWLYRRILPYESAMTVEDSYTSALLCCCELIRSGVTAFAEAGGQHVDGMGRAVGEAGLRAILAKSVMDFGDEVPAKLREPADEAIAVQENNVRRWNGQAEGRIRAGFGLRQILNNSAELIEKTRPPPTGSAWAFTCTLPRSPTSTSTRGRTMAGRP